MQVAYNTLCERRSGKHGSLKAAGKKCQLIKPEQESVLLDWAENEADMGKPMDMRDIRSFASQLAGKVAGKNWARRMVGRHPGLLTTKPVKLDPKCAKNFNKPVIQDFFDKLESLFSTYGEIPAEHIWNMDEKGIQLDGGRKGNSQKYLFFKKRRNRYWISSNNLELVTVVECISAGGQSIPLSFVLSEGPLPNLKKAKKGSIGRYVPFAILAI